MKRLVIVTVCALLLTACAPEPEVRVVTATPEPTATPPAPTSTIEATATPPFGGFSGYECRSAWYELNRGEDYDPALLVDTILNRDWSPDSIGYALKACIRAGWDGWRDEGSDIDPPECSMDPEFCLEE